MDTDVIKKENSNMMKTFEKSEYFCQVCSQRFQDDVSLMAHELLHDKTNYCILCKRQYLPKYYKIHVMDNHMNLVCKVCGKVYVRKHSLLLHMKTHTGRRFQCNKCDKSYTQSSHLSTHMRDIHENHEGVRFKCEKCTADFANKSSLGKHIRIIHPKNFICKCSVCFKEFEDKKMLAKHGTIHKQSTSQCGECGATFKNTRYLKEHQIKFHFRTEQCRYCDQKFHKSLLQRHIDRYHSAKICAKCGQTFFNKKSLIYHLKTHSTTSVYCQVCLQTYSKDRIDDHMQKHKETKFEKCGICRSSTLNMTEHDRLLHMTGEYYICKFCPEKFASRSDLLQHCKKGHKRVPKTIKRRKKVQWKRNLSKPFSKHRPFGCDLCLSSFKHKRLLKRHITCVHVEKTFKCKKCRRLFRTEKMLQDHKCGLLKVKTEYSEITIEETQILNVSERNSDFSIKKEADYSNEPFDGAEYKIYIKR